MLGMKKAAELVALEQAFASANEGGNGYAFISAPVAISALLDALDGGCHLVVSDGAHPDTYRMIEAIRRRSAGLKVGFADMSDLDALELSVTEETRLLWVETICGPRLSRADLGRVVEFASARNILVLADNSLLGHDVVKPLAEGCDIVFSSAPPDSGRGGLVAFSKSSSFIEDRFSYLQRAYDAMPGPAESDALRQALEASSGLLAMRAETASQLAAYLTEHENVAELFYAGDGCPDLSVIFNGTSEETDAALARLSRFKPGLVPGQAGTFWHYAHRDYEAVPEVIRRVLGIPDGLVRFGLPAQDGDAVIEDFKSAFG